MLSRSFDVYIAVDFSANRTPKSGKDSIWWSRASWPEGRLAVCEARNPRTRAAAQREIREELTAAVSRCEHVLIGFDFPYGYPAGFAATLGLPTPAWRSMWEFLRAEIHDDQEHGRNNRFEVAAAINARLGGTAPFWGCPESKRTVALAPTKSKPCRGLREFRHTERVARGPKSAWQLFYNGSVGSQVLLGIPLLAALRSDPQLAPVSAVWPFETGPALAPCCAGQARIVHAEIYPSLVRFPADASRVKDALQVEAQVRFLAEQDAAGTLSHLFEAPRALLAPELRDVVSEEGWILGVIPQHTDALPL